MGNAVSTAGDINGDGYGDLIIGADEVSLNGSHSNSSYVVLGTEQQINAPLNLANLDGSNGFRIDDGNAGYSVSGAGDINSDGLDDVIIGVPDANPNGQSSGASYVVFGQASGFNDVLDLSSLDGHNGFRLDGGRERYSSGFAVSSIGDFNGDGFDDLIMGAPTADPDGFRVDASYIVFGKASDFSATLKLFSLDGKNGLILKGLQPYDRFGEFVSGAGDVNGDLITGVSTGSLHDPSLLDSGSGYVIFGGNFTGAVTFLGTQAADKIEVGTSAAERFVAGDGNDTMSGGGGLKMNLTDVRGKIENIEVIDLTGGGNNILSVNFLDLLSLSDSSNTLKVDGNAGNSVTGLEGDWIDGGVSGDYHVYTQGAAILLVGINVTTDFV